jgi:TPR repeat protein
MGCGGGVEALKAVAKEIRKAKDIGKRASQIPIVNEAMHVSIEDALNELGAVAFEGAQT